MKNVKLYYAVYLLGFPITGALVGLLFYYIYTLINTNVNEALFPVFILLWSAFGLFAGIIGTKQILKIKSAIKHENKA